MSIEIHHLTPDLWPQFEDLFGKRGACYGCWCTHFRLPPAERRSGSRQSNKDHIRTRIEAGPPPGLLVLEDGVANGWMQIGPRADVPGVEQQGQGSAPVDATDADDPAVWAISCFFIRTKARGQGLTHRLVAGGIDFARSSGARMIEACPIDLSRDSRSVGLFVGSSRVFEQAGFQRLVERKAGRPLMRLIL